MQKTASARNFPQIMSSQIKAFHDKVQHNNLNEIVLGHLHRLNHEKEKQRKNLVKKGPPIDA